MPNNNRRYVAPTVNRPTAAVGSSHSAFIPIVSVSHIREYRAGNLLGFFTVDFRLGADDPYYPNANVLRVHGFKLWTIPGGVNPDIPKSPGPDGDDGKPVYFRVVDLPRLWREMAFLAITTAWEHYQQTGVLPQHNPQTED